VEKCDMFGRIKIRKSDKLFRELLLKERGERCQRCARRGRVEVSHFHGRRKENVRYDFENVDLLCGGCHRFFHESPSSYFTWKHEQLGEKRFKALEIRANTYKKRDDAMQEIILRKLLTLYERRNKK